jgi:hypothetical protein
MTRLTMALYHTGSSSIAIHLKPASDVWLLLTGQCLRALSRFRARALYILDCTLKSVSAGDDF